MNLEKFLTKEDKILQLLNVLSNKNVMNILVALHKSPNGIDNLVEHTKIEKKLLKKNLEDLENLNLVENKNNMYNITKKGNSALSVYGVVEFSILAHN